VAAEATLLVVSGLRRRVDDGGSDLQWLHDCTTLPKLPAVLRVRRLCTGDWWYVLSGHVAKREGPPLGEDTWNVATRDVTYLVQCFVVKAVDASVLVRRFTLNFQNVRWSPGHGTLYEVFLGE
jgi:hypothetical protein